jgi:flagellar hook-associated protein 3 FlgL
MAGSITGVTNLAQLLDTQRILSRQQTELGNLQKELSTGRKRDGLIGISLASFQQQGLASDTIRYQQYRQTTIQATIYTRAIDNTQYRTDLYAKSLQSMQDIGNEMRTELLKAQSTTPATYGVQATLVDGALNRLQSILNTTDGQRYIFAGNAFTTAPVRQLNGLDNAALVAGVNGFAAATNSPPRNATYANAIQTTPFTSPVNTAQFAGDGNTNVPGYIVNSLDAAAPSNANGEWIYSQTSISVSDSLNVDFGISATHGAFQNLINGLRNFKMALRWAQNTPNTYLQQDPTGNAQQYIAQAQAQIQRAVSDLGNLAGVNGANQALLRDMRSLQEDTVTSSTISADKIVAVDIGEVGTKIKGVQASLEASYITTRDLLNLNLAKFLR